jgi:hypothetical protein
VGDQGFDSGGSWRLSAPDGGEGFGQRLNGGGLAHGANTAPGITAVLFDPRDAPGIASERPPLPMRQQRRACAALGRCGC